MALRRIIRRHTNDRGEWFDQEVFEEYQSSWVMPSGGYITRAATFMMSTGTVPYDDIFTPQTVFAKSYVRCGWCGVKNKEDDPYCLGCGGPL